MITIGPYRLYQIAKYAWQRWGQQSAAAPTKAGPLASSSPAKKGAAVDAASSVARVKNSAQAGQGVSRDRIGSSPAAGPRNTGLGPARDGARGGVLSAVAEAGLSSKSRAEGQPGSSQPSGATDPENLTQFNGNAVDARPATIEPSSAEGSASTSSADESSPNSPGQPLDDRIHRSTESSPLAPTRAESDEIRRLMADPTLFTPSFKAPRNIVVLCHGM